MARPREFDIDDAIQKAMGVFWKHGYAGASLADLLAGIGIARGSFYKAFGSKKELFLQVLDRYDQEVVQPAVTMLQVGDGDGLERIAAVFENSLKRAMNGDRDGCLLCNTAAENGDIDPDITAKVDGQISSLTRGFMIALKDSKEWETATDDARQAQANSLTLSYVGLRILSKGGDTNPLKWGIDRTLATLRRES